tara:strand:+ start:1015 stop:2232 length:1218 start_codon:yes stop_codon:yes gene_type:complete
MSNLIKGQEDYVYIWTLGVEGVGDGSDKMVTVDVNPDSEKFGKVIDVVSLEGRGEAHHTGFTEDRRHIWAGQLDTNLVYIWDVATDPAKPKIVKSFDSSIGTGLVGPHTLYAIPGRMIILYLSNTKDHGGQTGFAVYTNEGELVSVHKMPTADEMPNADGYAYDMGINPKQNVMLTTSFTGWNNYMMDMGKMLNDPEAMKQFGNSMVLWDAKTLQPIKAFNIPGAPLELRWSLVEEDNWAVTANALTSAMWVIKQDDAGEWQSHHVATIGNPEELPLPTDISITADGNGLWVNTFGDGRTTFWDMTDPLNPKPGYSKKIGSQVNMVSQSWDGSRVYFTTSLLGNWDKKGKDDEQWLKMYNWDGNALTEVFTIDFYEEKLGRAHHMKFGTDSIKPAFSTPLSANDS